MMQCCDARAVMKLPGGEKLCKTHFCAYFEAKVRKTIRQFDLLGEKERLGVAISGGKDSLTVLSLLKHISDENPGIAITALAINEGIHGYRDATLETARAFCARIGVPLHVFSYEEEFGMALDGILRRHDVRPCSVCGVFRRYLLNRKARELGFTKLATGHNLDDECQSILMNQFRNDIKASARLGPKTGLKERQGFVTRIKPLYLCTEKEVTTYAFLNGILDAFAECPNAAKSYRAEVRDMLNDLENTSPGTKYSIVNSFLQTLPLLKEKFKDEALGTCPECGEPSSRGVCRACVWMRKVQATKKAEM
ncbi:TPA: TIGR00269 family protein [Candidatus Woesearchaeota archaeon]|nr:TIGR00269 family protein [Candidatus Woesearchaeota archaeon]